MREVVVLGAGMHRFGRFPELEVTDLGREAAVNALKEAGIKWPDVEIVFFSHVNQGMSAGQKVCGELGHTGVPIVNVENACASGTSAVILAFQSVASGQCEVAMALGVEKMGRGIVGGGEFNAAELELGLGLPPGRYALIARKFMEDYGVTRGQLALVAVKNRENAHCNPYATYQERLTLDEVLNARMICDPLTLYMCCPTADGGAAVVLGTREKAEELGIKPVISVVGTSLTSQPFVHGDMVDHSEIVRRAAKKAYDQAGLGPEDLNVVELHDCFAIAEISHYTNLGLCDEGEGGKLLEEGTTALTGRIPVNPSGGRLSLGHPLGATGVAQVAEIVWQLRGQAGARQVANAKVGLAHTLGARGGACGIVILSR